MDRREPRPWHGDVSSLATSQALTLGLSGQGADPIARSTEVRFDSAYGVDLVVPTDTAGPLASLTLSCEAAQASTLSAQLATSILNDAEPLGNPTRHRCVHASFRVLDDGEHPAQSVSDATTGSKRKSLTLVVAGCGSNGARRTPPRSAERRAACASG